MRATSRCLGVVGISIICVIAGCSGDDSPGATGSPSTAGKVTPPAGTGGSAAMIPGAPTGTPTTGQQPPATTPPTAMGAAGSNVPPVTTPPTTTPPATAGSGAMPMATAGSAPPAGTPPTPAGPEDGDPSMPVVSVPDVACGGPTGGFGLGSPNFKIDDRDMIVTYPCNKHAGAPVTFILNLHGTTPIEQHFYQHGYFSIHQFAASHNFIVVTPSSVVQQWGNGDDGKDEPHLMKIIDWVYSTLGGAGKFDIRGMWVGGHSWGGAYTARFGCKPELADKVKGLIMMSGGGVGGFGGAACGSMVSDIITTAEGDMRMPTDQGTVAMGHGCGAAQTEMILQNVHTFWADCQPGFVHANYYMLGKEHATFMDKEVVESIANWIKLSRQ